MAKQENLKSSHKNNIITLFLGKFIFNSNLDLLRNCGFIDSFVRVDDLFSINVLQDLSNTGKFDLYEGKKPLYLLFNNKKLKVKDLEDLILNLVVEDVEIIHSRELINDYKLVIVSFPKEYNADYDSIVSGKYSRLSEKFKKKFPSTKEVFNLHKEVLGKEYTIYHHIFNKTD